MKIDCQRHLFDIDPGVAYLNCGYMSPLSGDVVDAGSEALRAKTKPWKITATDFFAPSERLRETFGGLINASANDIALIPAASYGLSTASAILPVSEGQNIVMADEQFPSNVYPWLERAAEAGAHANLVKRPSDDDWTSAIVSEINSATAIVAIPQLHWTNGALFGLMKIRAVCNQVGAALVVDATQSAGAAPIDLAEIQPDFLVAAGYKWLMGPYSLGYLYVAPQWQTGRPIEQNWITRQDSENFAQLVNYTDSYADGARRFDVGERSNFALVPAAQAGLDLLGGWGVDNIAETLGALTNDLAAATAELGYHTAPEHLRAPHYLGISSDKPPAPDLLDRLAESKVFVSVRGSSIRITPHLYNSPEDCQQLLAALRAVAT